MRLFTAETRAARGGAEEEQEEKRGRVEGVPAGTDESDADLSVSPVGGGFACTTSDCVDPYGARPRPFTCPQSHTGSNPTWTRSWDLRFGDWGTIRNGEDAVLPIFCL